MTAGMASDQKAFISINFKFCAVFKEKKWRKIRNNKNQPSFTE